MIVVVDASVAVKWFVEEERRDLARDVLRDEFELAAPDLLLTEVANALRKKVRQGHVTMEQARAALADLPGLFDRLVGPRDTLEQSFEVACQINHPVADCVYIACARSMEATLLTDDETLYEKARTPELRVSALRLADWTHSLPADPRE